MKTKFKLLFVLLTLQIFIVSFKGIRPAIYLTSNILHLSKPDTVNVNSGIRVDTFNLSIMPPSSGVQFYRDGIIYLSSSKLEKKMPENHVSFGKSAARYALVNNDSIGNIKSFSANQSFTFPCEATTFSSDFNTMYYTRYSKKDHVNKIYKADCPMGNKDDWMFSDVPLSFCADNSDYTHPSLSADGKLLIFASNRESLTGGMDLFMSHNKEGMWSEPVNLGVRVNTISNELYPYLDPENNLYFSSDRKEGYGGYDIYVCKYSGDTWEKPVNLSTPLNTELDDVAFTVNRKDGKSGFYSIRQKNGKKSSQLYRVEIKESLSDNLLTLSQYFTKTESSHPALSQEPEKLKQQAEIVRDFDTSTTTLTSGKAAETITLVPDKAKKGSEVTKETSVNVAAPASKTTSSVKTAKVETKKEGVIYRIQFQSNVKSKGSYKLTIEGKTYDTYEYQYAGAFRTTIGEISSFSEAGKFQASVRKSGFPKAFVVAFKNGVRATDPALYK